MTALFPRRHRCAPQYALLAILLSLALPLAAAADATSFTTGYYQSFTDVNGNGLLDCGEPVRLVAAVLTNNDSPGVTGRILLPFSTTQGLRYLPGSLQIDNFPVPTIGCTGEVLDGNDPGDVSGEVRFSCPPDEPGDSSWAFIASYQALYFNSTSSTFQPTARFLLDDGRTLDRSEFQSFPANACGGSPNTVSVTKTAAGSGAPGTVLLFTITATAPAGAGGVQLTDVVPDNTTFDVAGSSPGWVCPSTAAGSLCRLPVGNILAGQTVTRFFAARVVSPLPATAESVTNTACAREGPRLVLGCGSTSTPTGGTPILALAKTLLSGSATPGATLTYRLSVANTGNQDAGAVTLTETVPANTTYSAAGSSPWTCSGSAAGSTCTLLLPGLAAGSSAAADFAVTVAATLPAGTAEIANTACAAAEGAAEDCSDVDVPSGGTPALALSKSVSGSSAPGGLLLYTLALQNTGNQGAAAVVVTEQVPDLTTFDAAASTPGWSCSPSSAAGSTCSLAAGSLAAGATASYTFAVRVVSPLPASATTIGNTACAEGTGLAPICDSVTTPTAGSPQLVFTKLYSGGPVLPSAVLTFDLTAGNTGNQDTGNVVLTETVPALATFEPGASTGGWACTPDGTAGSTCTFPLGPLPAGDSRSVTFAVRAAATLPANAQIVNVACAEIETPGGEATSRACGSTDTPAALTLASTLTATLLLDADHNGSPSAGDTLRYVLTLPNPQTTDLLGLVIHPALDPHTSLVAGSVVTDQGSVTSGNGAGDTIAEILIPSLGAGDTATIRFDATIASPLPAGLLRVAAQAFTSGSNFPDEASDDPGTPTPDDPTATDLVGTGPPDDPKEIPTLGEWGLLLLSLGLAAAGTLFLRHSVA